MIGPSFGDYTPILTHGSTHLRTGLRPLSGFVIENILSGLPAHVACGYYRTAGGAEINLILDMGGG